MPGVSARRFPSPLRYPGGKGKVANFVKLAFLQNDFIGHRYVEPYAGGAAVALTLLFEEYASQISINDLNRSVFAFWRATLEHTEELCRQIRDTPVTLEQWKRQRSVQDAESPDLLELGFSTFFLNRTNRSGIISGGVIGGQKQTGQWKIDARYNKTALIQRIKKIARHKSRITLTRMDAAAYLRDTLPELPSETFVFLDPPYYIKGEGLYENFYGHSDHTKIAELVARLECPWIVSYDAAVPILDLYQGFDRITYNLSYSAGRHTSGKEVMFFSKGSQRPAQESPANILSAIVDKARVERLSAGCRQRALL